MELTVDQALERGVAAHKEGKLQEAERLYRDILQTQPTHPVANHNLGVIAVAFGKNEVALPYFETAIANNAKQEQFWISYIDALIKLGEILKARGALSEGIRSGLKSDKINSLNQRLNPARKLDFFYKYLQQLGVFTSEEGKLLNGDSEAIPLLTNSFLNWFETQNWHSLNLLELGAGGSTIYFSKFFKSVTSYETNPVWYNTLLSEIPNNVNLVKVDSILKALKGKNLHNFDVILIDAGENRAKIARRIANGKYKGIIFFDNSEWYRESVGIFLKGGFVEIPFFGIKPVEDWVSCTSILAEPSRLGHILSSDWLSLPKLTALLPNNSWDDENN